MVASRPDSGPMVPWAVRTWRVLVRGHCVPPNLRRFARLSSSHFGPFKGAVSNRRNAMPPIGHGRTDTVPVSRSDSPGRQVDGNANHFPGRRPSRRRPGPPLLCLHRPPVASRLPACGLHFPDLARLGLLRLPSCTSRAAREEWPMRPPMLSRSLCSPASLGLYGSRRPQQQPLASNFGNTRLCQVGSLPGA